MRSSGHRVLITGGSRGIGLALAKQFHANGNQVVLVGREKASLESAAATLPGAAILIADISNSQERTALVRECGDVSILVNNAGTQLNGEFGDIPIADVQDEVQVNLVAPMLLAHALLPKLRACTEAAIVNVTSALALVPKQSASVYCATKAGLHSFSRSLRWQLEKTNVRVFDLMPPLVDTAMTAGRGSGKVSPEVVASEFWQGFSRDCFEIRVGKARAVGALARLAPGLAERIMRGT